MIEGLISVIVPVYNVKDYVEICLESLLKQTYSKIEIICIDDGSDDGSEHILDKYALLDSRVKVFHQTNKGVSVARNIALEYVEGEYLAFVDPDDYISNDMYSMLIEAMNRGNADISCCSYYMVKDNELLPMKNKCRMTCDTIDARKFLKYVYKRDSYKAVGGYIHTRLIRTDILKKNNKWLVKFDENIYYGEGTLFLANCMLMARKIIYVDKAMYYYVQRDSSAMHNYKRMLKKMGMVDAYASIIKVMEEANVKWSIMIWIKRFYAYHASLLIKYANKEDWHDNDELIKCEIKRYLIEYIITNLNHPRRIGEILRML